MAFNTAEGRATELAHRAWAFNTAVAKEFGMALQTSVCNMAEGRAFATVHRDSVFNMVAVRSCDMELPTLEFELVVVKA